MYETYLARLSSEWSRNIIQVTGPKWTKIEDGVSILNDYTKNLFYGFDDMISLYKFEEKKDKEAALQDTYDKVFKDASGPAVF